MKKLASALRRNVFVVMKNLAGGNKRFSLFLKGRPKEIGYLETRSSSVEGVPMISYSKIDKKFRGLGLGRKMYGEAMRRLPEGRLLSGVSVSPYAQRVWSKLKNNPSYKVDVSPGFKEYTRPSGGVGWYPDSEKMDGLRGRAYAGEKVTFPREEMLQGQIRSKALIRDKKKTAAVHSVVKQLRRVQIAANSRTLGSLLANRGRRG